MKKIINEKTLKIFIILQPILDLITSYQSTFLDFDISISLLFRGLSFAFVIFYLVLFCDNKKIKKYVIILISFFLIFVINMIFTKGLTYGIQESYTLVRFFYFPVMLVFFYEVNNRMKEKALLDKKMITYIASFYFIIVFIAFITSTSFLSYDDVNKIGYNGWFYSANERGSTYAILLPLLFTYVFKDIKIIGLILLGIFTMLILGTKVGYLGVVLVLASALVYYILRKGIFKDKNLIYLFSTLMLLITIALIITYLPVYKNITYQSGSIDEIIGDKSNMTEEEIRKAVEKDENYLIKDKDKNLVYSRREIFLEENIEYYNRQNLINKLFGSGTENKMLDGRLITPKVERDIFDIFFAFGILGFIIYSVPIIIIAIKITKNILKHFKKLLEPYIWFSLTSIIIGLAISYMSGHVMVSPSVSIYFTLIICSLYGNQKDFALIDKTI